MFGKEIDDDDDDDIDDDDDTDDDIDNDNDKQEEDDDVIDHLSYYETKFAVCYQSVIEKESDDGDDDDDDVLVLTGRKIRNGGTSKSFQFDTLYSN